MTLDDLTGKIINDDCLNVLKDIPDNSIDLICTDCPYHIVSGGCTNIPRKDEPSGIFNRRLAWNAENAKTGKLFSHNDIEFEEWLPELYRVLKNQSHCYIMINARNLAELQNKAEKVGFVFQQLLVWNKGNATPNRYYLNACEFILMLRKGSARNINNMGTKNILSVPNIIGNKCHPTEKPVELMEVLIANSTNENDIVLEPFAGGGSTCIAARNLKRRFIGIEIDEQYAKVANERLEQAQRQQMLF